MLPLNGTPLALDTLTFAAAALITPAAAREITRVGLQVESGISGPSPPFANDSASPEVVNAITTPAAPASLATRTFSLTLHPPRSTSATFPARFAGITSPTDRHARPT